MSYDKLHQQRISHWMLAAALLPAMVVGCSRPMGKVSRQSNVSGQASAGGKYIVPP